MRVMRYLFAIPMLFAAGAAWGQKAQERYKAVPVQQQIDMCRSAVANGSANAIELCSTALNNPLTDLSRSLCYYYRAQAYERAGDTNSALEDLNGALGLGSANNVPFFLGLRAQLLFKTGNYSAAIQDNTAVLRTKPSDSGIWFNRGQCYFQMHNWDLAIQDYNKSIELNPNWAPAYTSRALAYEAKGDLDRALQEYAAALDRFPNNGDALRGRERVEELKKAVLAAEAAVAAPAGATAGPLFLILEERGRVGELVSYIDSTGKVVLRTDFVQFGAFPFHEGLARFLAHSRARSRAPLADEEWKWGFMDRSGKVRVEPKYKRVRDFSEGLAAVNNGNEWGFVDSTGKLAIPMTRTADPGDFSEGLAAWGLSGRGYIDQAGQMVIPPQFEFGALAFSQGLACVQPHTALGRERKWGFIDKTGKMVIQPRLGMCGKLSEGMALVTINSLSGYIDKTGKVVVPPKYKEAYDFSEGLSLVCDTKCGFIDKAGTIVIALQYDSSSAIRSFSDGLASFYDTPSGKWGYIGKKGAVVIHPDYDGAGDFHEGLALVTFGGKPCYIDKTGKYVWPPTN